MDVDESPRRIPELWLEDGNIVLQAGNRQYCVYRGTLAACSPVFKDMFSFPQPPNSELVEGLPVVRLQDSSSQVTLFLRAIFQPNFFMPFPATTEYATIQACLRLSHRYEVEHLRLRALIHLSSRYRTTLRQFDAIAGFDSEAEEDDPSARPVSEIASWTSDSFTDDISVILLAREVEAPWVIPVAFYRISVGLGDLIDKPTSGGIFSTGLNCLGHQDQIALLRGHSLQTQASTTSILACFAQRLDSDGRGCKSAK
ncbi:hypothetical protein FB45DRAFT_1037042 [Roridomyces roridus]|uniref:BTB domain-containing protein n=1 Tax=Roridomyces roridus TaxID=1738132 RepID=A0AAD7B734_9AGAR|nr:hypothetical protein FB45DRAFT_1037042 [Roridomyces roridus]